MEKEYEDVRCLYCKTGKEEQVVSVIHENGWGRAIFAHRIRYIKKNGEWEKVKFTLMPNYVFVYAVRDEKRNTDYQKIPNVVRVLRYADGVEKLMGSDLRFADWLWQMNGDIGVIQTMKVGDRVEIVDEMLRELHGTILHINRRQKKVYVALDTQQISLRTWLAYEQVEKLDV